jgi:hypothetical protein
MEGSTLRHAFIAIAIATATLLLGCGSPEDKRDRGLTVGQEDAVPSSDRELGMTEAERQKQKLAEDSVEEREAFDRADEDL